MASIIANELIERFAILKKETIGLQADRDKFGARLDLLGSVLEIRMGRYEAARERSIFVQAHNSTWLIREIKLSFYWLLGKLKGETDELNRLKFKMDRSRKRVYGGIRRMTADFKSRAGDLHCKLVEFDKDFRLYQLSSGERKDLPITDEVVELRSSFTELKNDLETRFSELSALNGNTPDEADRPIKFTRKQVIYLLQELIPEFRTADNTRKAEFITKLTGYTSTKSIADEFSNIRGFADPRLLAEWKEKFKTSGRGRKRNNP